MPNPAHIFYMDQQAEKERKEIQSKYRMTLLHGIGFDVLKDMLTDLGFGMDIDPNNIAANALRNYGWHLLEKIGADVVPIERNE